MKLKINKFPFLQQLDSSDCGFTCIRIISKYYGVDIPVENKAFLESHITRQGLSFSEMTKVASKLGYHNLFVELGFEDIKENVILPAIFFWNQNHFIVVYKITKNKVYVSDPAFGKAVYTKEHFIQNWKGNSEKGVIHILSPLKEFYVNNEIEKEKIKNGILNIFKYLMKYKKQLYLLAVLLLLSSIIEFIFPFFTQKIIDRGVNNRDVSFLNLILLAQIVFFISKIGNQFYRSWLFVHISSRVGLQLVSDFLMKLMSLPINFFYSKSTGDLLERIDDHKRIENFLTNDLLKNVFAIFSLIVFSFILFHFSPTIFLIFLIGNTVQLIWVFSFLKKIKILDKKKFKIVAKEQNKNIELITGIQEIKLNSLENFKRNEWQKIQIELFNNNIENTKLNQKYESYRFMIFLTSILITFVAANQVINNTLSIGSMMSIIYIIGAVNAPISELINGVLSFQLLLVSITRINEINNIYNDPSDNKLNEFDKCSIYLSNLSFSYDNKRQILNDITFEAKKGTTTAIVGLSGSGKTTLIKLLLKFYTPKNGSITVGKTNLESIDDKTWRNQCGVIFQDSFIFSNSIAFNIALEDDYDIDRLLISLEYANIKTFVDELPLKYDTIIGQEGIGISQGQKQRILIARAIYKNPDYLFFDEATNSLDAENEKIIIGNIEKYFKGKTMFIVAHRLNTVINADQILVLENGRIVEKGTHDELISLKERYYNLIKNQLELGN